MLNHKEEPDTVTLTYKNIDEIVDSYLFIHWLYNFIMAHVETNDFWQYIDLLIIAFKHAIIVIIIQFKFFAYYYLQISYFPFIFRLINLWISSLQLWKISLFFSHINYDYWLRYKSFNKKNLRKLFYHFYFSFFISHITCSIFH